MAREGVKLDEKQFSDKPLICRITCAQNRDALQRLPLSLCPSPTGLKSARASCAQRPYVVRAGIKAES